MLDSWVVSLLLGGFCEVGMRLDERGKGSEFEVMDGNLVEVSRGEDC